VPKNVWLSGLRYCGAYRSFLGVAEKRFSSNLCRVQGATFSFRLREGFQAAAALSGWSISVHEYQRYLRPARDFGSGLYGRLRSLAMSSSIRNAIEIRQ
jgi:hypothetical protein